MKIGRKIDGWIAELEGKYSPSPTRENAIDAAVTYIVSGLEDKAENYHLLITGSYTSEEIAEIANNCKEKLDHFNIKCSFCKNPVYYGEELYKLGRLNGVVLIEKQGKTTKYELQKLKGFLDIANLHLVGSIWIEK